MPKRIVLKIDNTSGTPVNSKVCDLGLVDIVPQSTITLKQVYVKMDITTTNYDYLNIYITDIIGKNYVIDTDKGYTFLQIPLTSDREFNKAVPPVMTNIQWTRYSTNESFTMASKLHSQIEFGVLNRTYTQIPEADIKLIMLVFEYDDAPSDKPTIVYNNGVQSFSRDPNKMSIF